MNDWTCFIEDVTHNGICDISHLPENYPNFFDECDEYKYIRENTTVTFITDNGERTVSFKVSCWMYRFDNYFLFDNHIDENILTVYKAEKIYYQL